MKWSPEDHLRSIHEGWKLVNGCLTVAYNSQGLSPFAGTYGIVRHLRQKGKTSEWHKEVYLSLPWSLADNEMAREEGWIIQNRGRIATCYIYFETNGEALAYVVAQAKLGDPLHIKALTTITKNRLKQGAM